MNIKTDKYYAIVKKENNKTTTFFNNRIYLGKFVKSAYNQIKNKEEYQIMQVRLSALKETQN